MHFAQNAVKMERELNGILRSIKSRTGIDVAAVSRNGIVEASTFGEYFKIDADICDSGDNSPVKAEKYGKTYFSFSFNGTEFIGAIDGVDNISYNYALFIASFIENSQPRAVELGFDEQLLAVLLGESTKSRTAQFCSKYSIPRSNCFVVTFKCKKGRAQELKSFLTDYAIGSDSVVQIDDETCALIRFSDEDNDCYSSGEEYAACTIRSVYEELGLEISAFVGSIVRSFDEISFSFRNAVETERLAETFGVKTGVHSYKDFALFKMAEEMSQARINELLDVLLKPAARSVLDDEEIMLTVEEFLRNNLNVSEAARALYVHRNTLIYRLDKIKRITGMDIRDFNDATSFRLICVLSKLK